MEDTIVAISTAIGKSAISIVRVSGPDAIQIVSGIYRGVDLLNAPGNTINYGHIYDGKEMLDEVLVSVFGRRKVTREKMS